MCHLQKWIVSGLSDCHLLTHQHGTHAGCLAAGDIAYTVVAEQRRRCIGIVRRLQRQLYCLRRV